jgi:threonine aldolase
MMKRQCSLVAKGRLLGVQFEALFEGGDDCVYFENARRSNGTAKTLRDGLASLGVRFLGSSPTNQVFPILPAAAVRELEKDFFFYEWEAERDGMIPIRLVTGWGTTNEEVEAFLEAAKKLLK